MAGKENKKKTETTDLLSPVFWLWLRKDGDSLKLVTKELTWILHTKAEDKPMTDEAKHQQTFSCDVPWILHTKAEDKVTTKGQASTEMTV